MMSWKEIKKELKHLWFTATFNAPFKWTAFNVSLSVFLYKLRGIQRCPYHGYCTQSFWTGYCKKCGEIPKLPPMEETCTFCGEEKSVLQRASPNGDKEIWSICWECDKYIDWGQESSWGQQAESMGLQGKKMKPFDEWLFANYQVWPKGNYSLFALKKKNTL